jgi:hypothetical protein
MSFHPEGYSVCGLLDEYMLIVLESQKGVNYFAVKCYSMHSPVKLF